MWRIPKIWEGSDVWILGGGPSVPRQFNVPDSIIQSVTNGASPSLYSPYMSAIHSKHVIGINVAYLLGNWIDIVFFGDSGFFLNHMNGLAKFPNLKVSSHSGVAKYDWVKLSPRDNRHLLGISPNPVLVSWNHNSGSAAISLAAHAGAKRIILLGFDMKLNGSDQHWHKLYSAKTPQFYRHMLGFKQIAIDAKQMGIEIINACPDSAIKEFRKCNVNDLL